MFFERARPPAPQRTRRSVPVVCGVAALGSGGTTDNSSGLLVTASRDHVPPERYKTPPRMGTYYVVPEFVPCARIPLRTFAYRTCSEKPRAISDVFDRAFPK